LYKVSTSNGTIYSESDPVDVKADTGEARVELALGQGATLRGRIVEEESGQPIKDAQVTIQLPCCTPQGFEADPIASDAGGHYELAGLPGGAMVLSVTHRDYSDRATYVSVPTSGDKNLDVKMGHGKATLTGTVTLDGKPLPDAAIYIYRAANRNEYAESAVTSADGRYTVEGIPEGNQVLQVQALWGSEQVELRHSEELRIKGHKAVANVNFAGLVHLKGHLRSDPNEEGPNPHTMLWFAKRASADDLGQSFRSVAVDAEGNYQIYLEPGAYTVGLQEGSGAPLDVPENSREFVVNFELRDLAEASGIKLMAPGAPVEPKDVPDKQGL
jgi:hypothetical protein